MLKEEFNRNELGDVIYNLGKFDHSNFRSWSGIYVFRFFDRKREYFLPYFEIEKYDDEKLEQAKADKDFKEVILYRFPEKPPYDFLIRHYNHLLSLLITFFKEVFEEQAFSNGVQPRHKFYKIILPKSIYNKICECINKNGLLPIKDLIFEVIAIAQHNYIEDIHFWERKDNQKIVSTAQKEAGNVIELIELMEYRSSPKYPHGKKPAKLLRINFIFQEKTIKIEHPWLAQEFVEQIKEHYNGLAYKNWRLDLEEYHERFRNNVKKQNFKYNLALSYYNLLTKCGFFDVSSKPTPNNLMLCIVELMEFSLIKVGNEGETSEIKEKLIRVWIARNEIKEVITHLDVPYDQKKLLKYFEKDFLDQTNNIKRADALNTAYYLAKRFDVDNVLPELAHIAQILKEVQWLVGHQLSSSGLKPSNFSEYNSFQKLCSVVKDPNKIASIKFTITGDNQEYTLTEKLPLYLISKAIDDHVKDNQADYNTELVPTTIKQELDGSFIIKKEDRFCLPHERFLVKFVSSFYNFLLNESPPRENEFMPSKRYYSIIALMLNETWHFYRKIEDEWFITEKVKEWHSLSQTNK